MGDISATTVVLNLSIAARAYWIGLKALYLGANAVAAPISRSKTEAARREMKLALAAIEHLAAEMGLEWQSLPVDRQLRTQVGLLQDALYYASPEALRGFGSLKPATADGVLAWRRSAMTVIETLANAVEGKQTQMESLDLEMSAVGTLDTNALNRYQRSALDSFANAFAIDLLLLKAQSLAVLPPGHPTMSSPYDKQEMEQILAVASALEARLDTLISAFALSTPLGTAAVTVVHRSMHDAQECLRQLSGEASVLGDARAPEFARLSVMTGRNLMLALNLIG